MPSTLLTGTDRGTVEPPPGGTADQPENGRPSHVKRGLPTARCGRSAGRSILRPAHGTCGGPPEVGRAVRGPPQLPSPHHAEARPGHFLVEDVEGRRWRAGIEELARRRDGHPRALVAEGASRQDATVLPRDERVPVRRGQRLEHVAELCPAVIRGASAGTLANSACRRRSCSSWWRSSGRPVWLSTTRSTAHATLASSSRRNRTSSTEKRYSMRRVPRRVLATGGAR